MEVHRAQPGDTLVSLAQAYYGSAAYVPLLRDANPQVTDPTRVPAGTAIKIPPVPAGWQATNGPTASPGSRTPSNPPVVASNAASGDKRTYTVRAGDSFYRIAEQQLGNANRWKELLALNTKLVNGDPTRLRPGQVVVLPGS
jgi:nucleoid-associated protein YgaU